MHMNSWITFSAVAIVAITTGLCARQCFAQYSVQDSGISLERNKDGEVVAIKYTGPPELIAQQKDERSHWHEYPQLATITISHTRVTRKEMEYIAKLRSVRALHINCLPEEIDLPGDALGALRKMVNLEELYVVDDGFKASDWKFIEGLARLKRIRIHGRIDGNILSDICRHDDVCEIACDAVDGRIDAVTSKRLGSLPLRIADFGQVEDASAILQHLAGNGAVTELRILQSIIDDVWVSKVAQMKKLERLSAGRIAPESAAKLAGLKKVKSLELTFQPAAGFGKSGDLNEFGELKFLSLENWVAQDESLSVIRNCKNLEHVSLPRVELNDVAISVLASFPRLRYLSVANFRESDWSQAADRQLPHVKIDCRRRPDE